MDKTPYLLLAFVVGSLMPLQSALNAQIARTTHNGLFAVFANFAVGLALLSVLMVALRDRWPTPAQIQTLPWWTWSGGLLGTLFVTSAMFLLPRIGAAMTFSVVIAGQLAASVLLDHYGTLNIAQHAASIPRVLGVAFILAGVVLIHRA